MNKKIIIIAIFLISVLGLFFFYEPPQIYDLKNESNTESNTLSKSPKESLIDNLFKPRQSTAANFDWSNGRCKGKKGTVLLTAAPMNPENIAVIYPYGTIDPESGHVTPIDHQYYYPKNREQGPDLYDIFAPADGYIVLIAKRNRFVSEEGGINPVPDYYIVMEHSCSFWTYFDLVTSLVPEIQEEVGQLPDDEVFVSRGVRIPIKAGQRMGKIGLRSLDFGVYDSETKLSGFLVYKHYDGEPWKVHTVDPYDFFVEPIKSQLIAKTPRTAKPIGGKVDYDIDGKVIGNWFVEGSGGFPMKYKDKSWRDHLAIFPDAFDPAQFVFSHGNIAGRAQSYGIKKENPNPAIVGVDTGLVKYELVNFEYFIKDTNNPWNRLTYTEEVLSKSNTKVEGTALAQLIEPRKLKVEVFMGKTATQVSVFTNNAVMYER